MSMESDTISERSLSRFICDKCWTIAQTSARGPWQRAGALILSADEMCEREENSQRNLLRRLYKFGFRWHIPYPSGYEFRRVACMHYWEAE